MVPVSHRNFLHDPRSTHVIQEHTLLDPGAALVVVTLSMLSFSSLLYGTVESAHVGVNDPCPSSDVAGLSESNISVR